MNDAAAIAHRFASSVLVPVASMAALLLSSTTCDGRAGMVSHTGQEYRIQVVDVTTMGTVAVDDPVIRSTTTEEEDRLRLRLVAECKFATSAMTSTDEVYIAGLQRAATNLVASQLQMADLWRFVHELSVERVSFLDRGFRRAAGGTIAAMTDSQSAAMWENAAESIGDNTVHAMMQNRRNITAEGQPEDDVPAVVHQLEPSFDGEPIA